MGTRPTWAWPQGSQAGGKGRHQTRGHEWRISGHRSRRTSKERQLGGTVPWLPGKASLTEGPSPAVVCGEGAKADPNGRCWGGGKRRGAGRGSAWHGGQGTVGCSGDDPGSCQGRDPHGVRPHSTEQVCLAWGDARGGNPGGAGPGLQDLPAPHMASVGAAGGGPPLPPRRRWCSSRVSPETSSPRTHPAH